MDKRFDAVDKRFDAVDKRFENLIHYMDKRFDAVDKRFEAVDKRFEDMSRRFSILQWTILAGFSLMTVFMGLLSYYGKSGLFGY